MFNIAIILAVHLFCFSKAEIVGGNKLNAKQLHCELGFISKNIRGRCSKSLQERLDTEILSSDISQHVACSECVL